MPSRAQSREPLHLDERKYGVKPLRDQLANWGRAVINLTDMNRTPADTHRESFTDVVMLLVPRVRRRVINPWIEHDQVEGVVKQLAGEQRVTPLLESVESN